MAEVCGFSRHFIVRTHCNTGLIFETLLDNYKFVMKNCCCEHCARLFRVEAASFPELLVTLTLELLAYYSGAPREWVLPWGPGPVVPGSVAHGCCLRPSPVGTFTSISTRLEFKSLRIRTMQ